MNNTTYMAVTIAALFGVFFATISGNLTAALLLVGLLIAADMATDWSKP